MCLEKNIAFIASIIFFPLIFLGRCFYSFSLLKSSSSSGGVVLLYILLRVLSVTRQPCWNVLVRHIVVAEVVVSDIRRRLIVAGDAGRIRDSVLLRKHSEGH